MQGDTYAPVSDGLDVSDQNWLRQFLGLFAWLVYWFAVSLAYLIYTGGVLRYTSFLFFVSAGLMIYAIIVKNGLFYRIGFYVYAIYALFIIIYDALTLIFLWFVASLYEKIVGAALEIPKQTIDDKDTQEGIDKAKDIVGWALFGFKILITIPFLIVIVTEIVFVCFLRTRIKYFDAYEKYRLKTQSLQPSSPI